MMKARKPLEIARLLAEGRWKRNHIDSFHSQFGEKALLDALLCPFIEDCSTESLTHFVCQQSAGILLLDMMPQLDRPILPTIRRSLPFWNLSVEEWPFYLCRSYGKDAVLNAINEITETENLNTIEQQAIETIRYWLQINPDKMR